MSKRKTKTIDDELVKDANAALRRLSRRFPEASALAVLRSGEQIELAECLEIHVVDFDELIATMLAIEEGIEKGMLPLLHLFERRLGRSLSDIECRRIAKRMDKDGADKLGDVVLDLSPEELAAWLAPRKAAKRAS